jgi:predicted nuclease of restriction endonuclease-like (RecB) superfamily
MSKLIKIDKEYADWIRSISERFRLCQLKAATAVNTEMLRFYWSLGEDIMNLKAESRWGDNFFAHLSADLQDTMPDIKGFSITNLGYIKRFYILYFNYFKNHPQLEGEADTSLVSAIYPQLGGELFAIPWGHHKYIIDKFYNTPEKAIFYVRQTLQNGWSRAVLLNFMDADLYERQGKAISNFHQTLPALQSDLAQEITKDPYQFDFLSVSNKYREKELKDALIQNIVKFLLELGTGFAFVGREYRLVVGATEKFIDMLFYNFNLRCFVVIEIKTDKFDSEHIGQLGTYVAAVNHILRKKEDNPTIGLLICKTKDNILAQYALESSSQPIGVSEYELSKLYPADFKGTLPSIEDLEKELK